MEIEIPTSAYNERRYSRPYICKIVNKDRIWGQWIGSPGDKGLLSIDANAGDIIAKGQKDYRKSGRSDDWYGVVQKDGSISKYDTHIDAINAQREMIAIGDAGQDNPLASISDSDLIAELSRRGWTVTKGELQ